MDFGGMERVMSEITNYFSKQKLVNEVHLIILTKKKISYKIDSRINVHEPDFNYQNYTPILYMLKTLIYLRGKFNYIKPNVVLSFGDRYNSLTILASLFLKIRVFVSNRMNPTLSNGFFIDILNKSLYRFSHGIIAQTEYAKEIFLKRYNNKNIFVIHNPIKKIKIDSSLVKENIILNVGRLVDGKNQHLLIDYFKKINNLSWKMVFLGDGPNLQYLKKLAENYGLSSNIEFVGNTNDVEYYYNKSKIFAFVSSSEGFPNALGEAMSAGLSCMSFDCITGPSELLDDGKNGFLVPLFDNEIYINGLEQLMENDKLRLELGKNAIEKIQSFSIGGICKQYYGIFFNLLNKNEN